MEKTFKGTINGREFEAFKDGRLILDRGPVPDASTMEEIRGASHAFFCARHRPEPEVTVISRQAQQTTSPVNMAKARREAAIRARTMRFPPRSLVAPLPAQPGAVVPPRMNEENWLGVKPLDSGSRMLAQLRTNYEHWVAEGHAPSEVLTVLENRIKARRNNSDLRDAQVRLVGAWR